MLKFLVLLIALLTSSTCNNYEKSVIGALEKALDYCIENHKYINIDGLFGLVLGQAHIQSLLLDGTKKATEYERKIQFLENKAKKVIELTKPTIESSYKNDLFMGSLLIPKIWQKNITFQLNDLDLSFENNKTFGEINTYKKYLRYLSTSKFLEELSDKCFVEVLKAQPGCSKAHNCPISSKCRRYMIDDDYIDPTYGVTHRLLYLQTARSQKCNMDSHILANKINLYCSYILWEATKNYEFGFLDELDDLFLEQVTLCGYEGFEEFLQNDFIDHVLNIQTEHGCFTVRVSDENEDEHPRDKRSKREANYIKYGCNDHTTGLGVSTLALILRYLFKSE